MLSAPSQDTKCTPSQSKSQFLGQFFSEWLRYGGIFRRSVRATTKKVVNFFLPKKCTPRQNPGYAYAEGRTSRTKMTENFTIHNRISLQACHFGAGRSTAISIYHKGLKQRDVFLLRCMECRRGLTMRILSVCLSVRLSNACIVTKRKKAMFRFLYHTKEHLS